ncbi:hypothetical protein J4456_01455 [Candidatus Pacearchaeota archaeon]|nr:hypothetical protein [Candidatus Pacearchaeota archaeon]
MKIENKLLLIRDNIKPTFKNWKVTGVFNPGAIWLPNKKIMLMARIAEKVKERVNGPELSPIIISKKDYEVHYKKIFKKRIVMKKGEITYLKGGVVRLATMSHLRRVILSEDGFYIEEMEEKPTYVGVPGDGDFGVEDPRIVKIGNRYLMTYVSVCLHEGVCTSLAISHDGKHWDRKGIIFRQHNKDVVLFPDKINNRYVALHRPEGTMDFSKKSIWIYYSKDLMYWGREKSILMSRSDSWGESWVGSGVPPIKISKGWLLIYHGVKAFGNYNVYSVGAALLDLNNPERVLARTPRTRPLIRPTEEYEKKGHISFVVFPTGAVPTTDGEHVLLYCGGSDSVITVKKLSIKEVLESLEAVTEQI